MMNLFPLFLFLLLFITPNAVFAAEMTNIRGLPGKDTNIGDGIKCRAYCRSTHFFGEEDTEGVCRYTIESSKCDVKDDLYFTEWYVDSLGLLVLYGHRYTVDSRDFDSGYGKVPVIPEFGTVTLALTSLGSLAAIKKIRR